MIRRRLIRIPCICLLALSVAAWVVSYFQMLGVGRMGCQHTWSLEMECGTISYYWDTQSRLPDPNGPIWIWLHWPSDSQRMDYLHKIAAIRFLGFAYRPTPAWFQSWVLFVPFWFPTLLSTLLLCLVWRKTRPKHLGRGFPVDATIPKTTAPTPEGEIAPRHPTT
jgi:hypothetical protein